MGVKYTSDQIKAAGIMSIDGQLTVTKGRQVAKVKALPGLIDRAIPNLKVKNATKVEAHGLKFDSRLELYMYNQLQAAGIEFEFQRKYELLPKFKYGTESVRAINLTVDFWLPKHNILIDTKGFQTQQGALRWKLLKSILVKDHPKIYMPSSQKACDIIINNLKYNN